VGPTVAPAEPAAPSPGPRAPGLTVRAVPRVVTFGEAMVLLLAEPGLPLAEATTYRRQVAGAESTVAVGLARLGVPVGWFGRTGDDTLGGVVLGELRREGVDVSRARTDPAPTGLILRDCPRGRPVEVAYYRAGSAGSRLGAADVDAAYIAGAEVLHLTGLTPVLSASCLDATRAALDAAREGGAAVWFDPNLRRRLCPPEQAAPLLREVAARSDVVLAGVDEAELLTGGRTPDAMAAWFLERGARVVVLKDGAAGSRATDGGGWVRAEPPVVAVVDPVGAGDAYAAGFLAAHLDGGDLERCVRTAGAVASMVVQAPGDTPGLPTSAVLAAVLSAAVDVAR